MEILKRFKMQKMVSQKQQKITLTTVDDETFNELDMPTDEYNQDNTFRQTVFNPKQTNPSKMLSPRSQQETPQLQRYATQQTNKNTGNSSRPLETNTSLGTLSRFQFIH